MKKLTLSFFLLLLSLSINAQCPSGNLVLTSQAEIDNFSTNYPSCTSSLYNITVQGSDITNLDGLNAITSIGGDFVIKNNNSLYNFNGFNGLPLLDYVGGDLIIDNNPVLTALSGIQNIDELSINSLVITNNPSLAYCQIPLVCNFISQRPNEVIISNNKTDCNSEDEVIVSCSTLCPQGRVVLRTQADVDNFKINYPNCTVPNNLSIVGESITNLDELNLIMAVNGELVIGNTTYKTSLTNLEGLESLRWVKKGLFISENSNLASLDGLSSLESIGGRFTLGFNVSSAEGNPLLTSIADLKSLNSIGDGLYVYNSGLINLEGLGALSTIGEGSIEIVENDNLATLSGLDNLLDETVSTIKILANQSLVSLSSFSNLKYASYIQIDSNPVLESLNGLNSLIQVNDSPIVILGNASLTNLEGLNGLTSTYGLYVSSNQGIVNLSGLDNLNNVETLLQIQDNSKLENVNNLTSLVSLGMLSITSNDKLINLNGLNGLQNMDGQLGISNNLELIDIGGISNINFGINSSLGIINNPKLSICNIPSICRYLTYGGTYAIRDNLSGCNSFEEVIAGCDTYFNSITGNIRFDTDNDGCDNTYVLVSNLLVESNDGVNTYGTFTNKDGDYKVYVPEGNYVSTPIINVSNYTIAPSIQNSSFTGVGNTDTLNYYCITPSVSINDAIITILPLSDARPGFDADYKLVIQNSGTNSLSGSIIFQFDDTMQTFVSASQSPQNQTSDQLTFDYNDLTPFEPLEIALTMNTFTPPTVNGGDLLVFNATASQTGDVTPGNNSYFLNQTVINSFDPNDKKVLQGEEVTINDIDHYLDYIIRFQNTGSASAIDVRIKDELNDKLDWTTFTPTSMSHDGTIQITNGKDIEFIFEDINLPDRTSDEEGSNGYIAFKIKPKADVQVGDIVTGEANIYFDYNLPIITNTVNTEIVNNALSVSENKIEDSFKIYPNPTNDKIYISTNTGVNIEKIKIYSVAGKLLLEDNSAAKVINLKSFLKGIYFLNIVSEKGSVTKRVIRK